LNSKQDDADTISEILLRAAREPEFRNQLIKQSSIHSSLEQYNISDEAKSIVKNRHRFVDTYEAQDVTPMGFK